jgi:hypothetical protein
MQEELMRQLILLPFLLLLGVTLGSMGIAHTEGRNTCRANEVIWGWYLIIGLIGFIFYVCIFGW